MFDAYEAVDEIINEINEEYNESCYDEIYEELCERVECGLLSIADAELINEAAYEKYISESSDSKSQLQTIGSISTKYKISMNKAKSLIKNKHYKEAKKELEECVIDLRNSKRIIADMNINSEVETWVQLSGYVSDVVKETMIDMSIYAALTGIGIGTISMIKGKGKNIKSSLVLGANKSIYAATNPNAWKFLLKFNATINGICTILDNAISYFKHGQIDLGKRKLLNSIDKLDRHCIKMIKKVDKKIK